MFIVRKRIPDRLNAREGLPKDFAYGAAKDPRAG